MLTEFKKFECSLSEDGDKFVRALAVSISGDVHNPLSQVLVVAFSSDLHVETPFSQACSITTMHA